MEKQISVIIPVYKVEDYLRKCVDSVLAQTYRALEVILVDDGSPDGCGAICDEYAQKDSRVRVIHKENGGLSSARNAGLDVATGDYIGFVDSDDTIEPDMYEKLHAALTGTGADMAVCDLYYLWSDGRTETYTPLRGGIISRQMAFERTEKAPDGWRYVTAWNRLYKKSIFDAVRFREGKIHEDELALAAIFERCSQIAVVPDRLYWDVCRQGSIMTSPISIKRLAAVEAFVERYDFYRQKGWQDLAAAVLRKAYTSLWAVLAHVDVRENAAAIRPWVRAVAARQMKRLDLRAAWLELYYLRRLASGKRA